MRRLYLIASLALVLFANPVGAQRFFRPASSASSTTSAPSGSSATAKPASPSTPEPGSYNLKIYYRSKGASDWRVYGLYLVDPGTRLAKHLQGQGYEVYAQRTSEPLVRNPARPADPHLPAAQTVTLAQAENVFRVLAARTDLAYRFPADGCYARTHLMIKHMQQLGLHPWKIWAFANGHDMQVATDNHPSGEVTWEYHVAPVLRVRGPLGGQRWYVLDPSLFGQPVTVEQWEGALGRSPYGLRPNLFITRLGEAVGRPLDKPATGSGYWPAGDPSEGVDAHAEAIMRKFKPYEGRWPPKGYPGSVGWTGPAGLPSSIPQVEPVANVQAD